MTQAAPIDFGTTISCTFDLAPVGILISGLQVLSEALIRRLLTPPGRLLDDPDYGYDLFGELGDNMGPAQLAQVASSIDLEFVKDQRVRSSSSTASFNAATRALTTTSTITTAAGPFSLVLTLNASAVPPLVAQILPAPPQ